MKAKIKSLLFGSITLALFLATSVSRAETVVWYENFDDGRGDDRWYAENGVWQMGSPTQGPPTNSLGCRTYSGCQGVTVGLDQDYQSYSDTRLIRIESFTVPDANQFPRLRFWHWYNFAGPRWNGSRTDEGSYGYVEVNGEEVSIRYTSSGSGVWTRPVIDLSRYAGQTVEVAFHFHSALGRAQGWFIDDITLVTGAPALNPPDGFELGLGDWSVESGTWETGNNTSGPPTNNAGWRVHGGSNCAATVLTGDFASYSDSRLVSPVFIVPDANQFPRLRFWHWYNFAGPRWNGSRTDEGSYGYVEIRVGTNDWQQFLNAPIYDSSSSDVWTRPSFDLTPYSGQRVEVAFHFHSALGTSPGWYIDDVTIATGTPRIPNSEDFESGLNDWYTESGTWEVGVPSAGPAVNASGFRAHSGTNCMATVLAGNYASYTDSRIICPSFIVPPSACNPKLRFWHWYSFAGPRWNGSRTDEGSYGYVEIKAGTNDWETVYPSYSGESGPWTQPLIRLNQYEGQTIQLAFHVHSALGTAPGWYIDDVRLDHDTAVVLLNSPTVRTQNSVCIPIGVAVTSSVSQATFTLQAPSGTLGNLTATPQGCWTNVTVTPQGDSTWLIRLFGGCTNVQMGATPIGSICFTALAPQSAFVPLLVMNPSVISPVGIPQMAVGAGSRPVMIANQPLLEAWSGRNHERMLTIYGKTNTAYEISYRTNLLSTAWAAGWTNTVPTSMSYTARLPGNLSSVPSLFLRAREK